MIISSESESLRNVKILCVIRLSNLVNAPTSIPALPSLFVCDGAVADTKSEGGAGIEVGECAFP